MSEVHIEGLTLAFEDRGDKFAPVIILINGLGKTKEQWPDLLIKKLVQSNYRVVMIDNRDSGASTYFEEFSIHFSDVSEVLFKTRTKIDPPGSYSIEDMASDVESLMNVLNIKKAHVLGWSFGGLIAASLACRLPNRILSLSTISSAFFKSSFVFQLSLIQELQNFLSIEFPIKHILKEKSFKALSAISVQTITQRDQNAVYRQLYAVANAINISKQLLRLKIPVLTIYGARDNLFSMLAREQNLAVFKNYQEIKIPNMNHEISANVIATIADEIVLHCAQSGS